MRLWTRNLRKADWVGFWTLAAALCAGILISPGTPWAEPDLQRCAACHVQPEIRDLSRAGWADIFRKKEKIFERIGILGAPGTTKVPESYREYERGISFTLEELKSYRDYFVANSPESLIDQKEDKVVLEKTTVFQEGFRKPIAPDGIGRFLAVTIDEERGNILLGDMVGRKVIVLDASGRRKREFSVPGVPVQIRPYRRSLLVTSIGEDPFPNENRYGMVYVIGNYDDLLTDPAQAVIPVYGGLHRSIEAIPLGSRAADGMLIAEFGSLTGDVKIHYPGGKPPLTVVHESGNVGIEYADLTGDGRNEIVLLNSQQHERLRICGEPKDNAKAVACKVIDQRRPSFGFNSLRVKDMNGDGRLDIITTNGDNMDLESMPLRPYHGIRIYLNEGDQKFTEKKFLPMHGVIQSIPADFDQDGDVDILAISSFPDFDQVPMQATVFFENQGGMKFIPKSIAEKTPGLWVAASSGDFDQDGDLDVVLVGAYPPWNQSRWEPAFKGKERISYLALENTTK